MYFKTFVVGALSTNCYLIADDETQKAAIIDPGGDPESVITAIEEDSLKPTLLLLTHGHMDHISANELLKKRYDLQICIHQYDAPKLTSPEKNYSHFMGYGIVSPAADRLIEDGDVLSLGELAIRVLYVPGHSFGGVAFYLEREKVVFSGDSLFCQSIGRTDFEDGSYPQLIDSIKRQLLSLPDDTRVYPGHGPDTSIEIERSENPYLQN